jgi:DivIVA domain-containing protein
MPLDRHSVIRTDFPMSRRGYDRIAVDRHLDEIAQQVEALGRPSSVGATASAQVQSILDAAEASAAEIERRAWEDASRVQEASDQALARARQHIGALGEASRVLRERIDGLVAEVEALAGNLAGMEIETGEAVEGGFEPQDTMAFDPVLEDEVAEAALAETPQPRAMPEPRFDRMPEEHGNGNGRTEWFAQGPPAWTGGAATQQAGTQEARESARLVALNMADGGQPREAADRYLAGLYAPAEREAILDEIYGSR